MKAARVVFGLLVLINMALYLFYAIAYYFTGQGINNAVIYTIRYGFVGAGFLEYWELATVSVFYIVFSLIFTFWISFRRPAGKISRRICTYPSFLLMLTSLLASPAAADLYGLYSGMNRQPDAAFDEFTAPFAVTMPEDRAVTDLPELLSAKAVPTYVHTVNEPADRDKYFNDFGVTEIYTDFLAPDTE